MPKFRVHEVDSTGTPDSGAISNIVYIPGRASANVEPELFTTPKSFKDAIAENGYDKEDLSAKMAYQLLKLGMQVLYEGFVIDPVDSGLNPAPKINWEKLEDKALYDIRFLTTGGYWCPTKEMIVCAAKRCDAVALLDSREYDVTTLRTEVESISNAVNTVWDGDTTTDPMSFASMFVPNVKMSISNLDGGVDEEWCPASFGYLCAFAKSVQTNPLWYAVAGYYRGAIPNLLDVDHKYSTAEIEMLQARAKTSEVALDGDGDNIGIAINAIAPERPFGVLVWGNRTARTNEDGGNNVGITKATSFLNVRLLETEISKTAYNSARQYVFEQNSEILWANFTSKIATLLDRMVTGNGILDYDITKVATTKKARLAAKITVVPIEAVEDFDIEIELADEISITE